MVDNTTGDATGDLQGKNQPQGEKLTSTGDPFLGGRVPDRGGEEQMQKKGRENATHTRTHKHPQTPTVPHHTRAQRQGHLSGWMCVNVWRCVCGCENGWSVDGRRLFCSASDYCWYWLCVCVVTSLFYRLHLSLSLLLSSPPHLLLTTTLLSLHLSLSLSPLPLGIITFINTIIHTRSFKTPLSTLLFVFHQQQQQ